MFTAKDTSKIQLYCVLYPPTTTVQVDASAKTESLLQKIVLNYTAHLFCLCCHFSLQYTLTQSQILNSLAKSIYFFILFFSIFLMETPFQNSYPILRN